MKPWRERTDLTFDSCHFRKDKCGNLVLVAGQGRIGEGDSPTWKLTDAWCQAQGWVLVEEAEGAYWELPPPGDDPLGLGRF